MTQSADSSTIHPTPGHWTPGSPVARPRRMVVVGAVAAGTSAGTQARRNDPSIEIVIYERDRDISYSGCGIPLFLGGQVKNADQLHPRDSAWFADHHRIDVRTRHEVVSVDPDTLASMREKNTANGFLSPISAARRCSTSVILFLITAGEAAHRRHTDFSLWARRKPGSLA